MTSSETRLAVAAASSAKRSGAATVGSVRRVPSSPVESPLATDHHGDATVAAPRGRGDQHLGGCGRDHL